MLVAFFIVAVAGRTSVVSLPACDDVATHPQIICAFVAKPNVYPTTSLLLMHQA